MRIRVKMCGFTDATTIAEAVDAGVDAIGLVLDPSPRQISMDVARSLMALIPSFCCSVNSW